MWRMKHILLVMAMVALVGCGESKEEKAAKAKAIAEAKAAGKAEEQSLIVEQAIREQLEKPTGELTEADLGKVTKLKLNSTRITDSGLKEVTKLKQLKELYLVSTKITDEGLKEVAQLKQLRSLDLSFTKSTPAGVAELQKALPKCRIER